MKQRLLFLIFILIPVFIYSQTTTFFKNLGGSEGQDVALVSDGGYIVVGNGGRNIYLVRADNRGNIMWSKSYDNLSIHGSSGFSVRQTLDGGFIVAGRLGEPDTISIGRFKVILMKTDALGEIQWTFEWNSGVGDIAYSVEQTPDAGYIVAGAMDMRTYSLPTSSFLMKLNANGDSVWTCYYDTLSVAYSVVNTFDGGYVFTGCNSYEPYLIKVNSSGDTEWSKIGNFGFMGCANEVIQTPDSGFVITGSSYSDTVNGFLCKFNKSGDLLWTKHYGGSDDDFLYAMDTHNDGGFVLCGAAGSYSSGQTIWLIRTDSYGDTLWTRVYEDQGSGIGWGVKATPDGGNVITGNNEGLFLLKTDSFGNTIHISEAKTDKKDKPLLYPNPSGDYINIEVESGQFIEKAELYTIDGSFLRDFTTKNNVLNVSDIPSGIYLLLLEVDDEVVRQRIVLK